MPMRKGTKMSVIIKWMAMPESCWKCPLETDYGTCGYYSMFVEAGHDSNYEKRPDDCPLVELPDPVKHGKWIEYPIADEMNQCSECGILRFGESNYCPNCGAKMDGGEIHDHYNCTGCGFMSTCTDEEAQQCLKPHISQ